MCVILDACMYSDFCDPQNHHMKPLRKWIDKNGKIAYSATKKFESELPERMKGIFASYREAGKLKLVNKGAVMRIQNSLTGLRSNDPHIIALAKVAEVNLLVSSDKKLQRDFHTFIKNGKVYQKKSHERLLYKRSCP